jgi:DNA repair protein RadC
MTYEIVSKRKAHSVTLSTPEDVYQVVKRYAKAKQEYFIVLTLNGAHAVLSISIASIGLVNKTIVHPREVFNRAIHDMATAIIVCHNHPSGLPSPSEEDIKITKCLMDAGNLLGIPLLDHLIITKGGFTSLNKDGFLSRLRMEGSADCVPPTMSSYQNAK